MRANTSQFQMAAPIDRHAVADFDLISLSKIDMCLRHALSPQKEECSLNNVQ